MAAATSTSKMVPKVSICSGRHCERTLSSGPFKSNLCEQCMAKMRSRRIVSTKDAHVDTLLEHSGEKKSDYNIPEISLPLAVPQGPDANDSTLEIPSQSDDSASKFSKMRFSQPKRSSFTIPYQTLVASQDPSSDIAADSNGLPSLHFNSRGEIINFLRHRARAEGLHISGNIEQSNRKERPEIMPKCSRCHCTMPGYYLDDMCPDCRIDMSVISRTTSLTSIITPVNVQLMTPTPIRVTSNATPDISKPSLTEIQSNVDDDGDMDIDDLEFTYPTSPNIVQVEALGPKRLDIDTEDMPQPGPLKRHKASHPEIIDLTPPPLSHTSKLRNTAEPFSISNRKDTKSTPFRSLKLCATANCTGVISADSFATRCLNCVRHDWKSKRSKLSAPITQIHDVMTSNEILKEQDQTPSKRRKKPKAVSWADEISDVIMDDVKGDRLVDLGSDRLSENEPPILSPNSPADFHKKLVPKIRLIVHPPLSAAIVESIPSTGERSESVSSPHQLDLDQNTSSIPSKEVVTGWDSELTELSDEVEDTDSTCESTSESEVNDGCSSSTSIRLKIRIPPRPDGVYTRKCASPRCNQVLATKYRWKSCVMCRAQSRDYQRRRQNIQGRHTRLDQELLEAQNMGTPLSSDLHKQDQQIEDELVGLVHGARLCSIRNCTYVIPPVEEYRWKMCALCRLRRREKKRQDRLDGSTKGSARQSVTLLMQKTINSLPLRRGSWPADRCQSIDCGMLVVDFKSYQCKQCIARRNWLMNRNGDSPKARRLTQGRQCVEKPRRSSPYPQFKCFSALLLEFKNRLGGFVQAQSVFFLFKQIKNANALFAFDGEFSIVALDFDLIKRKDEVNYQVMKYKREIEHVGRIKFNSKRLVSVLEGGGIAIRFVSVYSVPVLQAAVYDNKTVINTVLKDMQCELEIANVPDDSHRFIPGQRTIIRFRLLG